MRHHPARWRRPSFQLWSCRALVPEAQESADFPKLWGPRTNARRNLHNQQQEQQPPHLREGPGCVGSRVFGLLGVCGAWTLPGPIPKALHAGSP